MDAKSSKPIIDINTTAGEYFFLRAKATDDFEHKLTLLKRSAQHQHYQGSVTLCQYYVTIDKSDKAISQAKHLLPSHGMQAYVFLIELYDRLGCTAKSQHQQKNYYRELIQVATEIIQRTHNSDEAANNSTFSSNHIIQCLQEKERELFQRGIFSPEEMYELKNLQFEQQFQLQLR